MNFEWPGDRCVLCLERAELTEEHIIPSSLGGILTGNFLCKPCNDRLGATVEAPAKTDPSVRLAVNHLQSEVPRLAKKLTEGQDFVSRGPGGIEPGTIRDGEFKVSARCRKDGSLIQDAGTAPGSIEKILRKKGFGEIPIKEALEQLADVPANATVSIGPDLDVSTWTTDAIELDLRRGEPLSAVFLLKIAYEFLAGHLGTAIYDDAQQVSKLRSVICKRIEEHPCYSIERLIAPDYKPFHGIGFEGNDPYAIVQIRFFGKLAYRVHLKNLAVGGDRYVYTHNLKSDEEDIRLVNANDPHYESR